MTSGTILTAGHAGEPVPLNAPKWKGALTLGYRAPQSGWTGAVRGRFVDVTATHVPSDADHTTSLAVGRASARASPASIWSSATSRSVAARMARGR